MKLALLNPLWLVLLAFILPDMTPRRPRTVRLSRSASRPEFKRFLVANDVRQQAAEAIQDLRRVALLPITADSTFMPADALAVTMNLNHDLHYVPGVLPADLTTVAQIEVNDANQKQLLREIAERLKSEILIVGRLVSNNGAVTVRLTAYRATDEEIREVAASEASGKPEELVETGDDALLALLEKLDMAPPADRRQQMKHLLANNDAAVRHCAQGFELLLQVMSSVGAEARIDTEALSREALEHADEAINADPEYVLAYLVKASALENLDRPAEVKATLEAAKAKLNRADELTRLEILGDYERFVNGKRGVEKAAEHYDAMLEISPSHLRALLSLVECFAAEEGRPTEGDIEEAAIYAARLIAAHPGSPIAEMF